MTKPLACVLLATLLTCTGCFTTAPPDVAPAPAPTSVHVSKALPPVTPEQITETNGHQVAQALEDEINREQQHNMLNTGSR